MDYSTNRLPSMWWKATSLSRVRMDVYDCPFMYAVIFRVCMSVHDLISFSTRTPVMNLQLAGLLRADCVEGPSVAPD